eukprot:6462172-Amphidinium_carterae.1
MSLPAKWSIMRIQAHANMTLSFPQEFVSMNSVRRLRLVPSWLSSWRMNLHLSQWPHPNLETLLLSVETQRVRLQRTSSSCTQGRTPSTTIFNKSQLNLVSIPSSTDACNTEGALWSLPLCCVLVYGKRFASLLVRLPVYSG